MAANTDDMKQILENYSNDLLSRCWDDWAIAAAKSQSRPVLALLINEGEARQMPALAMERLRADRGSIKKTQAFASKTIAAASARTAALACASVVAAAKQQHVKRVHVVKLVSGVAANLSPTAPAAVHDLPTRSVHLVCGLEAPVQPPLPPPPCSGCHRACQAASLVSSRHPALSQEETVAEELLTDSSPGMSLKAESMNAEVRDCVSDSPAIR